jgi:hypothetical protein
MNAQTTLNSIEQAVQLLRRLELKLEKMPELSRELTPDWTERVKSKLLRLKESVEVSAKWGAGDSSRWQNTPGHVDGLCRDLKLEELCQLDWVDTKAISNKFREGWRACSANNSNFSIISKLAEEAATFYLDPQSNVVEMEKIKARATAAEKEIQKMAAMLAETLKQNTTGEGVQLQANYFEQIAKSCQTRALVWLITIVLMCVALIGCGVYIMFYDSVKSSGQGPEMLNHIAGRVLIITALFYFLRVATQNYRANQHNHTVNTHRAKALMIYGVMVKTIEDKTTQSIVLTKAADAIFGHQVSGHDQSTAGKESNDFRVNVNTDKGS